MFSLLCLCFMLCSHHLDILLVQRIMGFFVLLTHKSMRSENSIRDVARIQNMWEFCNYRWAQYVSKMQSESMYSKSCYLNTAYNVIFQPEYLSSQTLYISWLPAFYLHLCRSHVFSHQEIGGYHRFLQYGKN